MGKLVLRGGGTSGVSAFVPRPTEGIKPIGALYRQPTVEKLNRMVNVFVYDTSLQPLRPLGAREHAEKLKRMLLDFLAH